MENTEQNGHGETRMDRVERLMDMLVADHVKFSDEHNKLLTAQVVLTDRVEKLAISVQKTDEQVKENTKQIKETGDQIKATDKRLKELNEDLDRRIGALVSSVGKIVSQLPGL